MTTATALAVELGTARDELLTAIDGVGSDELLRRPPGEPTADDARWSIRDVLWHVGEYEDFVRRWVDGTRRGVAVQPFKPRLRPQHMETPELLRAWLDQTRRQTAVLLAKLSNEELDAPRTSASGRETTFALALAALASHDHAHAEQVRTLRADAEADAASSG